MAYYVGQKVVCVDNVSITEYDKGNDTLPNIGQVYTIRSHLHDPRLDLQPHLYLLKEIHNGHRNYIYIGYVETHWPHRWFKPLKNVEIVNELLISASRPSIIPKVKEKVTV